MPRTRRIKDFSFIYHVMVKSISDTTLFKNNHDKDKYLLLLKKCQEKLGFKLYGYCLMDNHAHMMIDANGADISKIMHYINQCYAQYYNIKHKREGHLFKDRFKSKVVDNENYLFTLSAYIHKNPKDIEKYKLHPENYNYSSLGIYLGLRKDTLEIIDQDFVMSFFGTNVIEARHRYYNFVLACDDDMLKNHFEFEDEKSEYRSERTILKRCYTPEDVIDFVSVYTNISKDAFKTKYSKRALTYRAICIFLMRYYCDFTYKDICNIIGNLSLSRVSKLSDLGLELIKTDQLYMNIHQDFLKYKLS